MNPADQFLCPEMSPAIDPGHRCLPTFNSKTSRTHNIAPPQKFTTHAHTRQKQPSVNYPVFDYQTGS